MQATNGQDDFGFEPIEDDFGFESAPETMPESSRRGLLRTGARVAETVAGAPGDLLNLITEASLYLPEKAGQALTGREDFGEPFRKALKETAPYKTLPTSSQLRERHKEASGGLTEPQTEEEKSTDEFTELASALALSPNKISGFKQLATHIGKSLGKAALAKGAKETVKGLGAEEGGQTAAELGTILLTSIIKPGSAAKYAGSLFQEAKASIPKGQTIRTGKLANDLANTKTELLKGDMTTTKKKVLDSLENLEKKISSGRIDPGELTEFYKDINETLSARNLFDTLGGGLSSSEKKLLRQRYDMLRTNIRDTLNEYGKVNPKFGKAWTSGNQAYSAIAQSKRVMNYIKDHGKYGPGAILADVFLTSPIQAATHAGVAAGGGYAAIKTGEVLARIYKSPALRKHYSDVIKFAVAENAAAMNQSIKKLEEEMERQGKISSVKSIGKTYQG